SAPIESGLRYIAAHWPADRVESQPAGSCRWFQPVQLDWLSGGVNDRGVHWQRQSRAESHVHGDLETASGNHGQNDVNWQSKYPKVCALPTSGHNRLSS